MYTQNIPARRRIELGQAFQRFGDLPSFLDFEQALASEGLILDTVKLKLNGDSHLAIVGDAMIRPLVHLGLDEEVARWFSRWDAIDYCVPLSAGQQRWIVGRQRWIRMTGSTQDLPKDRWYDFSGYTAQLSVEDVTSLMAYAIRSKRLDDMVLAAVESRCATTIPKLVTVFGPCSSPTSKAA